MHGLGVAPTPAIAEALYIGLITDTGRFMYENTTPRAHRMAAELIEAGVDVPGVYRRLYEDMPTGKLALLALALAQLQRYDDGELTIAALSAEDFRAADAEESYSEGIIDQLRALQGTKVAVLVRELSSGERKGQHKVSLRATDDDVDVSVIARAQGGGGHRRAAGFSTGLEGERARRVPARRDRRAAAPGARRERRAGARLSAGGAGGPATAGERAERRDGRRPADRQAGRHQLPRRRRGGPARARRQARPRSATRARSTRSRPACCWSWSAGRRRPSAADGAAEALRDGRPAGGAPRRPATRRGRSPRPGASRRIRRELPTGEIRQRPPAYSAVKIDGERAYKRARRGESFEMPERIVTVHALRAALARAGGPAGSARGVRDRMRLGHLRALADRRPRRRLLPGAAADRDRPVRRRTTRSRRRRGAASWSEPPLGAACGGPLRIARLERAAIGETAAARRHLGCAPVKITRLPDVERGAAAQRRRRHLRRRPPRPPRGDRRLRQRADVRPAPGLGRRAPAHAEAADARSSARPS